MGANSQNWIDGHCHLADSRIADQLDELLLRSRAAGITGWVQGGVDPEDWARQKALRERLGHAVAMAFGLHPWWVARATPEQVAAGLETLRRELPLAQAAGEMGIDAHPRHGGNVPQQEKAFEAQLQLARALRKPLVLHIVEAHSLALSHLKKWGPYPAGGIVHSFHGARDVAQDYLDLGLTLSIGAAILRPGYKTLKAALPTIPADRLVLETDCPDGASGPDALVAVAEAVASLQNRRREEVLQSSTFALKAIFGMK